MDNTSRIDLTTEIVSSYVRNNTVETADVPTIVKEVHAALSSLGRPQEEPAPEKVPVVSVRASVKPDYVACMECGKKQKMLRRHLQTAHGMTPEQYRKDYGLSIDYPMVAPNYSEQRRELAKEIGLGRKKQSDKAAGSGRKPAARKRSGEDQTG